VAGRLAIARVDEQNFHAVADEPRGRSAEDRFQIVRMRAEGENVKAVPACTSCHADIGSAAATATSISR
jgi:cytochrome c553